METTLRILLTLAAALALAGPASAQMNHGDMDHAGMDHAGMDHAGMDHSGMEHSGMEHSGMDHGADHSHSETGMAMDRQGDALLLADQPELAAALANGGEPVVAKVLGAVCDFCATAMNKTLGKRNEVAAVYVDLDAKTLNLVLEPGATMDDATIREAVRKSGYKVDSIARGAAVVGS